MPTNTSLYWSSRHNHTAVYTHTKFKISAIYIKSMMIMSCEDNNDDADGINSDNRKANNSIWCVSLFCVWGNDTLEHNF